MLPSRPILGFALVLISACNALEATSAAPDASLPSSPDAAAAFAGPPWGAEALPPGAEVVTANEMAGFAAEDGFQIITSSGLDEAAARAQAKVTAARQLVGDLVAADPSLARLVPTPPTESASLHALPDGNYRLSMGAQTVILQGSDWLYKEAAASVSLTPSRPNRESEYRSLIDLLPDDRRSDLPAADGLAAMTDDALAAAQAELIRRVETEVPSEPFVTIASATKLPDLVSFPGTGCRNHQPNDLYARLDWPLKSSTTRVRDQGSRGTCTAHAIVGALEARIFRSRGFATDYSEQELYAVAKGLWFPTGGAYGDGISGDDVLDELESTGGRIDAELRWPYNPSESRVDNEDTHTYTHSCDGYPNGYCSNTNHQMRIVCTGSGAARVCATRLPPGVTGAGTDPVKLTGWVSLWNGLEPENSLASIRAHLNAGHPVVLSIEADDRFKDAAEMDPDPSGGDLGPGIVNWPGGGDAIGGHELLIVGYLANGQLPTDVAGGEAYGGGYLIGKNSWGCKGDGGYMYLAYDWVIDQAKGAYAVTGVATDAAAPEAALSVNKSLLGAPGNVQFTVAVNEHTTKVEIFRGLGTDTKILTKTVPGGAPANVTAIDGFIDGGQNGVYVYWARATDQFGNAAASNQVGVRVQIDDVAPQIQLAADFDHVLAPGQVVLHATASDNVGVARVKFYRGFQLVGEDPVAPYTVAHTVLPGDVGTWSYVAVALDAAGNQKMSAPITVTVTIKLRPIISSFTATPSALPVGGGAATLSWDVAGATTVAISPGIGTVAAQGTTAVTVTQSATYILTATNSAGTTTATAAITVPVVPPPIITSFTASPMALPSAGGTSTLAWGVLGAGTTLAIDNGVGDVSALTSKSVTVAATTTYRLTATNAGGTSTKDVTVTVAAVTPPTIAAFTATPSTLPTGGGATSLAWATSGATTVTIDGGVGTVAASGARSVPVTQTTTFVLTASNAAGTKTASVTVSVAAGSPPVIVSFAASPSSLPAGGGASTLSWTVSGTQPTLSIDRGVGDVTGLGSKSVTVGSTTTYRLTAANGAGTATMDATVTVAGASPLVVYASPGGSDTANDCHDEAAPCKTIAHAISQVGAGGTVWLLDGAYTEASCGGCVEIVVSAGITVQSKNPGGARLGSKMQMTGGTLAEVVIDRSLGFARVRLTAGTSVLRGIRWKGAFAGPGAGYSGLDIEGASIATLVPGMATNYAAETTSENAAYYALIEVRDTARLTITGGSFDGPGVGFGSNPGTNATPGALVVTGSATLVLDHVTLRAVNRGILLMNNGTVKLLDSTVDARSMTAPGWGIKATNNSASETATIVVQDSEITGFVANNTAGIVVATYNGSNSSSATVSLVRSTLSGSSLGVYVDSVSKATIHGSELAVDDNLLGGIRAVGAVTIDIDGGSLSRNGVATTGTLFGGMTLGTGANQVRLRNVAVVDNKSSVVNAATLSDTGLTLAGDATSTFDLGTAADPGGNTITGNTTSSSTTGIDVEVNAAVTVTAVGNTFAPGVQGADGAGHYVLGTAPCGTASCDVTSGAGANYRVSTGTLRLAE